MFQRRSSVFAAAVHRRHHRGERDGRFRAGRDGTNDGTVEDQTAGVCPARPSPSRTAPYALERQATTDENGNFAVQLLPPGRYRVEVSAQGFKTVALEEIDINVTQTTTVNIKLETGAVQGGDRDGHG